MSTDTRFRDIAAKGIPVCAAISAMWAFIVLGHINSGVAQVHGVGQPSYGISALSGKLFESPGKLHVEGILATWNGVEDLHTELGAWRLWYAGIDLVLIVSYVGLLWWLLNGGPESRDPDRQVGREWKHLLPGFLAFVELAEDLLQLNPMWSPTALYSLTRVKWALVVVMVVLIVVNLVAWISEHPAERARGLRSAVELMGRLRVQLAVAAVYALLMLAPITDQPIDLVRRTVEDWSVLIPALGALTVISMVLHYSRSSTEPASRKKFSQLWVLPVASVALWGLAQVTQLSRLRAPAVLLFVIWFVGGLAGDWLGHGDKQRAAATSVPEGPVAAGPDVAAVSVPEGLVAAGPEAAAVPKPEGPVAAGPDEEKRALLKARYCVTAVPVIVTALALGAAETDPAFFGESTWAHRVALMVSLLAANAAVLIAAELVHREPGQEMDPEAPGRRPLIRYGIQGVPFIGLVAMVLWDRETSNFLGGFGVITFCLAAVVVIVAVLQLLVNRWEPPQGLYVLGFRRIPLLSLLVAWVFLAYSLDQEGNHRIDTMPPGKNVARTTADAAFRAWADKCVSAGPRPLVLVSASGGGIRAAYWTASVLDRLAPPDPSKEACGPAQKVFAASGTSGGALGITGYSTRFDSDAARVEKGDLAWPRQQFEGDHLARTLAGMFVYDLPNVFVNIGGYDRARALEESWTDANQHLDRAFGWAPDAQRGGPEIILNGTATNGCRVTISALKLGAPGQSGCAGETATVSPGALDTAELLCGAEIKRKTAVLLSARFTYVSPSGALPRCGDRAPVHVVDGGYAENNGAQSLVDLYTGSLEPAVRAYNAAHPVNCVVPVYLHISNGYQATTPTVLGRRASELITPLSTMMAVRERLPEVALQRARIAMSSDVGCSQKSHDGRELPRYFKIEPSEHPGVRAPLGWTLSRAARSDLDRQLNAIACETPWRSPAHKGWEQLTGWLDFKAYCPDGT